MFPQENIFACGITVPNPINSENMSGCWRPSKRVLTIWYMYSEQIPCFYSQGKKEQETLTENEV